MDKRTLKTKILELKEENKTYQEISNILMNDYGIKMSRQAVCGMYNRLTSDEASKHTKELMILTSDIINYAAIGYKTSNIKEFIIDKIDKITLKEIDETIESNKEYMNEIFNNHVNIMKTLLNDGEMLDEIVDRLSYNSVKPTNNCLDKMISIATEQLVKEASTEVLARVFSSSGNRAAIKRVITEHNLDITFRDIGKIINKC